MLTFEGVVIRERAFGETDKFIDVLTRDRGIVEILVKGARKIIGSSGSSTQLFAYSKFCVRQQRDRYYLNSAEPNRIFYGLRNNLKKLSLASYFADAVGFSVTPRMSEEYKNDVLRLFLNTLHYLEKDLRDLNFLKSLFELRLISDIGMMPDIVMCRKCGHYEPEKIVFFMENGFFLCGECAGGEEIRDSFEGDAGLLHTVRHILLADFSRLYNFKVTGKTAERLAEFSEQYFCIHMGRNFKTLDFYKNLT